MKHLNARNVFILIVLVHLGLKWDVFTTDLIGHHAWRQTQTQSTILNFVEEDFNILNPRRDCRGSGDGIFRREFPIMQWLYAIPYKILGEHIVISRVLSFGISILTLFGFFRFLGHQVRDRRVALAGAWMLSFSPTFYYHSINPMPDNFALCTVIWGLALWLKWSDKPRSYTYITALVMFGLAALAKAPFAVFLLFPLGMAMREGRRIAIRTVLWIALAGLPAIAWYAAVKPGWTGDPIATGILSSTTPASSLALLVLHHIHSTLPELLVNYGATPFFVIGCAMMLVSRPVSGPLRSGYLALCAGLVVYYAYAFEVISTMHDYHFFPFLPCIFAIGAYGLSVVLRWRNRLWNVIALVLLISLPVFAVARTAVWRDSAEPRIDKELVVFRDAMRGAIPPDSRIVTGNDDSHFIHMYFLDKKGWCFNENRLTAGQLGTYISEGAEYLVSNTRAVDEAADISRHLDHLVIECGRFRVYRLKRGSH